MSIFKDHNLCEWREVCLGDIARIRRGASPRPIDNPRWFAESGPGWVRISDVTRSDGRLRATEQYLSQDGVDRSVRIGRGDVIMSICATIGEPVIVEMDACIHDGFVVFDQFENSLDHHFLLHLLRKIAPEFKASGQTGTQANLNTGIVNGKVVTIPPDTFEQSRIAAVLDTVDEAIAKAEAVIAKLKQVRAGLLHNLLTRGLDENGQLRDPVAHPEQFQDSPIGRIPRKWEISRLGGCSSLITSGSRGWAAHYRKDGPMFLRIGNLTREHINLRFDDVVRVCPPRGSEGARTKVEAGDILISITADLGIIGVIPSFFGEAYVNQHIALIRPNRKIVSRWLGRFLASGPGAKQFQMLNDTGAKAGLNLPAVESLLIAVPAHEEQLMASQALDAIDADIDKQIAFAEKLCHIKSALMADLLTGRVRVPADIFQEHS